MNTETLQEIVREGYQFRTPSLIDRVKAQGYQVTVLQNCDSIYLADPHGIGVIFDTRTGMEILRKLDEFYNHVKRI